MKEPSFQFVLPATYEGLARLNSAMRKYLDGLQLSERCVYVAVLTAEELITNIIKYAFDDACPPDEIRVLLKAQTETLILEIQDRGNPFNPTTYPAPQSVHSLLEQPIGGLGIHLVRQMARSMHYERDDSTNRLTVQITRLR